MTTTSLPIFNSADLKPLIFAPQYQVTQLTQYPPPSNYMKSLFYLITIGHYSLLADWWILTHSKLK